MSEGLTAIEQLIRAAKERDELRDQRDRAVRALEAIAHGGLTRWGRRAALEEMLSEPWAQEVLDE